MGTFQTETVQGEKETAQYEHFVFERPGNRICLSLGFSPDIFGC